MYKLLFLLLTILPNTVQAQQAHSGDDTFRWQGKIEEVKLFENQGIPFLEWTSDSVLVESDSLQQFTHIQGRFKEKVLQATLNARPFVVNPDGTFDIHFAFTGKLKTFILTVIDMKNKVYRMQYKITGKDHQEVFVETKIIQRWRFSAGTGLTLISYRQQNVTPFSEKAVTVKGSVSYRLVPEKVDLGFSSFYNVVPFGSTSTKGFKMQYLGLNGRIGYNLIGAPSHFRVNINGGIYYNTSFSTIGFGNMMGPQLYPEFIYVFKNGNSLLLYGKFSPAFSISNSFSFSDNREAAAGLHYGFPISISGFSSRMSVGVDVSQLKLSVPPDWGCTNTYSLSTGFSF